VDAVNKILQLNQVPVVRNSIDVFSNDLPGLPSCKEFKLWIYLVLDTKSISMTPYIIASKELRKLKDQLQNLLDNETHTLSFLFFLINNKLFFNDNYIILYLLIMGCLANVYKIGSRGTIYWEFIDSWGLIWATPLF
jgi:hypothetical protein